MANRIKLIDNRDPIGEERLHTGEVEKLVGVKTHVPKRMSGWCTRRHGLKHFGEMQDAAYAMLDKWEAAPTERSGKGGSCVYRPVAVVVDNYGIAIHVDSGSCRVVPFNYVVPEQVEG